MNLGSNYFLDVGANSNPHSVVPKGRNQICWDPTGFNASLLPGQAKITLAEYQSILMVHLHELLGGNYGHEFVEIWLDGGYPASMADELAAS